MDKKLCRDCDTWKPITDFVKQKKAKNGVGAYCKPCHNARGKKSILRNHGSSRNYHLTRRYGLTEGGVKELIEKQGGVCPICRAAEPEHVDHDHATGLVRGILCFNCNQGLGNFRDNQAALAAAVEYLNDPPIKGQPVPLLAQGDLLGEDMQERGERLLHSRNRKGGQ